MLILKKIYEILKRIIISVFLLYSFNLVMSPLEIMIPINMITVAFIFIPILCSIITIVAMMFYNVEEDKMDNFESVLDL